MMAGRTASPPLPPTPTVEATSLSSLTELATHPPVHPGTLPAAAARPLVLYIARVPGSRDVFLTPVKPKDKVVSAEDVQSSLYFVHVNGDDDHEILDPPRRPSSATAATTTDDASQQTTTAMNGAQWRPALPARPPHPASPLPDPIDDRMAGVDGAPRPAARKPLTAHNGMNAPAAGTPSPPPPPPPRHVEWPGRPQPTPPDEPRHRASLHADNVRLLRHSYHSDENNPYVRQYPSEAAPDSAAPDEGALHVESGALTLIRRDPVSGQQWNVASIHDPPSADAVRRSSTFRNAAAIHRTKQGGRPVYLDITNAGYAPFIDRDGAGEPRTSTSTRSSDGEPPPDGTFRRRLYMPGARPADPGDAPARARRSMDLRKTMREGALADLTGGLPGSPHADRRNKGYSFTSPWDGHCEFTTGATGRSLKCRHTRAPHGPVEVSELRFNLPASAAKAAAAAAASTPGSEKRGSYFSRHSRLLSSENGGRTTPTPSVLLDEDGRVGLTLGQEKAGGGFGGKQAKLGKLIIEPHGLEMLDLLVAANVGLWWRAYERV